MREQLFQQGYAAAIKVLSASECRRLMRLATVANRPSPLDWEKGYGATFREYYDVATHPAILEPVADVLGGSVVLWGACLLERRPGAVHPWHTDIETCQPDCRAVSVWLGLEGTCRDAALQIIPGSHRWGVSVQELRHEHRLERNEATTETVVGWGRSRDPHCHAVAADVADGDAIFFDGKLWHASENWTARMRYALLLQYASSDSPIRMPAFDDLDWPFRNSPLPLPPCVLLRGEANPSVNRIVPAPPASSNIRLSTRVHPLELPLAPHASEGWKPYHQFYGTTADIGTMSCHASTLAPGCCPHPPHTHDEEELLLVLAGEVDVILPEVPDPSGGSRHRLRRGEFVYYPASFPHTLEAAGSVPANYLMFKWLANATGFPAPIAFGRFDANGRSPDGCPPGFQPRLLFEGPTAWLRKLHAHVSTLPPGGGYEPHIDAHDVAIVVLDGEIETAGQRVGKHAVVFFPGGEPHGMRNPGEDAARYLVFEFHGSQQTMGGDLVEDAPELTWSQIAVRDDRADRGPSPREPQAPTVALLDAAGSPDVGDQDAPQPAAVPGPSFLSKLRDPQRWKRKLEQILRRFRDAA